MCHAEKMHGLTGGSRHFVSWALISWLWLGAAQAQKASPPPLESHGQGDGAFTIDAFKVVGRHRLEQRLFADSLTPRRVMRLAHSATLLAATVEGERLDVYLRPVLPEADGRPTISLAIFIDGAQEGTLVVEPHRGPWFPVARRLGPGPHLVELVRLQEAQAGELFFGGAATPPGGKVAPAPLAARRLWFIGDSITATYGTLCKDAETPFSFWSEDAAHGFAWLVGQTLDADIEVVASSGRGLWRNGDGSFGATVPQLFSRELPQHPEAFMADIKPKPDAVVVNLGTNDLRRKLTRRDEEKFVATYLALLGRLRHMAPEALLVLASGPMLPKSSHDGRQPRAQHERLLRRVVAEASRAHLKHIETLSFVPQDGVVGFGCQFHPNIATQQQMAATLTDFLAHHLSWELR